MTAAPGYLRFPHIVGDEIVFTAENDVWLADTTGGRAHRLTADGVPVSSPRLSPDGAQVAWVSERAGEPEVFGMPTAGGEPRQLTFFGQPRTRVLGFDRDGRLVVVSDAYQPFRTHAWAYAIDVREGADARPERLPYGPVNSLTVSEAGAVVLGTGSAQDYAHWKRYRGGTASRLWLDSDGSGQFTELLASIPGPKMAPNWTGNRLALLSDFEGHGNVYSVAADGGDLRRHTDHEAFYARQLSGDGSRLIYRHAGDLWLLDSLDADSRPRQLDIWLGSPRAGRAVAPVKAEDFLGDLSVDRTGRASALEVRGNIVWLTHRNGPARTVASVAGVRHRLPVVLEPSAPNADPSVAYVTGAEGPDALEIAAPDGSTRRFGAGEIGRVLELVASPDGSTLAVATHDGRLLAISTADGGIRQLERNASGDPSGLSFSPDSKWVAYSAPEATRELRSIRLAELATGAVTAVTSQRFEDTSPTFSEDGKYLTFLSARTFDPVYDAHVFDLAFPLATRPYLVTLAADTPSPFEPELHGQADPDTEAAALATAQPETAPADSDSAPATTAAVRVDVEGIDARVVPFPVAAGRLDELRAVKGGVIWLNSPITGELGESRNPGDETRPSLQRWDFGKRKLVELAERVDAVEASGNGTKLVVRDEHALKLVPASSKPAEDGSDTVEIDLSRIQLTVDPPAEWRQMLDETARLMREHYWIEDMAGIAWDAEVDKYRPLLDRVTTRDDVSDLLWEVNGETGSSHAYESKPPGEKNPLLKPAYLGADFERDENGRWVITRIVPGDNSARNARSPLTAPGVAVHPGDAILAVNGHPVGPNGPAELLRGSADKAVELRVQTPDGERSTVVIPLADEADLRYLDCVASRRAQVHALGGGRIGYVHVPDMMSRGWAAFHRDLRVEMAKDALVVDTRENGGGHTSQLVIEKLSRRVLGYDTSRHYSTTSYPDSAPRGPLVSLANEWAGSDGDIVNAAFKAMRLGPVIGTRTWGGVIGIDGRYQLVDGTRVTQPRFSFWFEEFGWSVENHGVDPDLVVERPPQAWAAGEDPQLEAGVRYLLDELAGWPAPALPDVSQRPLRRAPALPPRP